MSQLKESRWVAPAVSGGRLVLLNGLFDLSYGPCDVVLLDGNQLHSITSLCTKCQDKGRKELERFSLILFSTFKRSKAPTTEWQSWWWDAVLFTE